MEKLSLTLPPGRNQAKFSIRTGAERHAAPAEVETSCQCRGSEIELPGDARGRRRCRGLVAPQAVGPAQFHTPASPSKADFAAHAHVKGGQGAFTGCRVNAHKVFNRSTSALPARACCRPGARQGAAAPHGRSPHLDRSSRQLINAVASAEVLARPGLDRSPAGRPANSVSMVSDPGLPVLHHRARPYVTALGHAYAAPEQARDLGRAIHHAMDSPKGRSRKNQRLLERQARPKCEFPSTANASRKCARSVR